MEVFKYYSEVDVQVNEMKQSISVMAYVIMDLVGFCICGTLQGSYESSAYHIKAALMLKLGFLGDYELKTSLNDSSGLELITSGNPGEAIRNTIRDGIKAVVESAMRDVDRTARDAINKILEEALNTFSLDHVGLKVDTRPGSEKLEVHLDLIILNNPTTISICINRSHGQDLTSCQSRTILSEFVNEVSNISMFYLCTVVLDCNSLSFAIIVFQFVTTRRSCTMWMICHK